MGETARQRGSDTGEGTRPRYAPVRTFRDFVAWQRATELSVAVYDATREMPANERFGLTNQMRRAAVSVPSNIAEGHARQSRAEYLRFLRMGARFARGAFNPVRNRGSHSDDATRCSVERSHRRVRSDPASTYPFSRSHQRSKQRNPQRMSKPFTQFITDALRSHLHSSPVSLPRCVAVSLSEPSQ